MTTPPSSPLPTETDVLIVGAGPVGVALATSLALLGVDHVVVDPLPGPAPGSKAAGVQPRTLEYLDRIGAAETLVAAGERGTGFAVHDADTTLLHLDYSRLVTPYPFLLLVGQQTTEEVLGARAAEVGARIVRSHRLLGWTADFPGVTATVTGPDGVVRAVRARYLAGADGVHSTVRRTAGIAFTGTSPGQRYALADVRFAAPPDNRDTAFFFAEGGLLLFSALPGGLHRVVASVPDDSGPPTGSDVEALIEHRGGKPYRGATVAEVVAASTYHVQQRVADRFVDGPVALLGDAAHTHSPAGGQGMNTGIQDAANLAWRLAEIVRHGADPGLLAGYATERTPVAQGVVAFTGQVGALATLRGADRTALRNAALGSVGTVPGMAEWLGGRLSQLDVGYAAPGTGPTPGTRLDPGLLTSGPAGLSWVLADPAATAPGAAGRLEVVPATGIDRTALLRPDGYVDAVGLDVAQATARLGGGTR